MGGMSIFAILAVAIGILTTSCGSRGRIRGDYQSLVIFASIGGSFKNMEQDLTAAQIKFSQMISGGCFLLFTPYQHHNLSLLAYLS